MLVGYARTSTLEQEAGLDAQLRDLTGVGCKKLFQEQVSSVGPRAQLEAALDFCREGDTLVVTKLDRLARSVTPGQAPGAADREGRGAAHPVHGRGHGYTDRQADAQRHGQRGAVRA